MRVMDGLMSFPTLLLALLVLFTLGPSKMNIAATIGFVSMPIIARVVRSTTLSLKSMEFIQSARLRGESAAYIVFREILPNVMPVIGVEASVRLSYSILAVASLGFLGLGIQPPSPGLGPGDQLWSPVSDQCPLDRHRSDGRRSLARYRRQSSC